MEFITAISANAIDFSPPSTSISSVFLLIRGEKLYLLLLMWRDEKINPIRNLLVWVSSCYRHVPGKKLLQGILNVSSVPLIFADFGVNCFPEKEIIFWFAFVPKLYPRTIIFEPGICPSGYSIAVITGFE